jgi:hypothetical protein
MWLAEIGLSEYIGPGWRGQLARVLRWHKRVRALGVPSSAIDGMPPFDYLYAFFQNCYHLRDFLKNSNAVTQASLDAFIKATPAMALCRQIANGTKHLVLDSSKTKLDVRPSIGREYHPTGWPGKRTGTNEEYFILVEEPATGDVQRFDLQDLADQCVEAWMGFLRNEHLLS